MTDPSIPISKTKILVPQRRAELITRPRLLKALEPAVDRKLTLLSAPAGYGKTSLLVDLADNASVPVCWLSLDLLDRDPQRFLAYMTGALAHKYPALAGTIQPLLSQLKSIEQEAESLLVALTNELYEQAEEDFLFIIDDYHLIDDQPVVAGLLSRFLQLADENCHVILSSRVPPGLPDLTLMIAREQAAGIGQAELAFSPNEIQLFLLQNRHRAVSDESARELSERTGGWITGLILGDQVGGDPITNADTYAYLSGQVLDQQPAHLREFLLRTSLFDAFDAGLCAEVLSSVYEQPQEWQDLIDDVLQRSLFVLPLANQHHRWVRYHPLFREYLQQRLREERPSEIGIILKSTIKVSQRSGEWEKAYSACQQLDDPEITASLIEASGFEMMHRAFSTLETWVASLARVAAADRPELLSLRGAMAIMKENYAEAIDLLGVAINTFRAQGNTSGLSLALVRRSFARRLLGDYAASLLEAEEAITLVGSRSDLQSISAEALRMKGLALVRMGRTRDALPFLEQSLEIYVAIDEAPSIPKLLHETAMVYFAVGEIEKAKVSYEQARHIWVNGNNHFSLAGTLNNLGVMHHQTGAYEQAVRAFEAGLSAARRVSYARGEALLLLGLGDLCAELREFDLANQAYEQAAPIAHRFPGSFMDTYLAWAKVNLALLQQNPSESSQILGELGDKLERSQSKYDHALRDMLIGRIDLAQGRTHSSVEKLERARAAFVTDGRTAESILSATWLAAALVQAGRIGMSRRQIRQVLKWGQTLPHVSTVALMQARPWLEKLRFDEQVGKTLAQALREVDQLEELIPKMRRLIRRHAKSVRPKSVGLKVVALDMSRVELNGEKISVARWKTHSVRELFFYMFAVKRPLTKEQIARAMWPDIEEDSQVHLRFKNELYRLRKAVGRDLINFDGEHYFVNRPIDYEYDVEDFDALIAEARASGSHSEQIDSYERALALFKAPYLEDISAAWVWPERQRLNYVFFAAVEALLNLYQQRGQVLSAIHLCQRALDFDASFEGAYRMMMKLYHEMGDRPSVFRTYHNCQEQVKRLCDSAPSAETEALYRRLME